MQGLLSPPRVRPSVSASTPRRTARLCLLVLLAGCSGDGPSGPADGPAVVQLSPAANAVGAPAATGILLRLDATLDPASVSPDVIQVFGRWSGVATGATSLEDAGTALVFEPDRAFAAGEQVMVVVRAGALRTVDGQVLERGYAWQFWAAAAPAGLGFRLDRTLPVRRPGESRIQTYGAYAGDLDGDGDSDLMLPNEIANDVRVLLNDGQGGYTDLRVYPIPDGARPSTNEGADFDGDGDIDFAVGNSTGRFLSVFLGAGDGTFTHHANLDAGARVRGLCVLDLENDGDMDMVTASAQPGLVSIFTNDGLAGFRRAATLDVGPEAWSCATGDFDGDGVMDVVVGARGDRTLTVLRSDGLGGLEESWTGDVAADAWMLAAADLDGDGAVDAAAVAPGAGRLLIAYGDGAGGIDRSESSPLEGFPLAVDLGDLDGDGDLDLVTASYESREFDLFENDGAGDLRHAGALPAPGAASCAVLYDRDGDGRLDIAGIDEVEDLVLFFGR